MDNLTAQLQEVLGENLNAAVEDEAGTGDENHREDLLAEDENLDEAVEGDVESEDDGVIRTIADLAEANEWDAEDLYALEVSFRDDDKPLPIGQLKDEIERTRRERNELAQRMQVQQQQMAELQQMAQGQQGQDAQVMQMHGQYRVLEGYLSSPELAQLKTKDPGAAALKVQEVQQLMGNIQNQMAQYQQNQMAMQQHFRQQSIAEGQQVLRQHIPEWSDPKVEQAEKRGIAQVFLDAGYNEQEVAGLTDPKAVMIARELMHLRALHSAGKKAVKQVKASPKRSLKGGRLGKSKTGANRLAERARQTGNKRDVTHAARALLFGD
jgi:hypothetical protein